MRKHPTSSSYITEKKPRISQFRKKEGTGAEMFPAIVSGVVTGDEPVINGPLSQYMSAILSRETEIALFYHPNLAPKFFITRSRVVKQSFFSPLGQYGRRVTKAHWPIFFPVPDNCHRSLCES